MHCNNWIFGSLIWIKVRLLLRRSYIRFIFMSCLSQNIDLSLEGGGGDGRTTFFFRLSLSLPLEVILPTRGRFRYHYSLGPLTCRTDRTFLFGSCWRFISRLIFTWGFGTCSNQQVWQTALKKWQIQKMCCFCGQRPSCGNYQTNYKSPYVYECVLCVTFFGPDGIPHTRFRPKCHLILDYVWLVCLAQTK